MRRTAPLGFATLFLASCSLGDSIVYSPNLTKYRGGVAEWAARNGELLAEIHGAPFGPGVTSDAVAKAVPVPAWVGKRMTTSPGPGTPKDYRVVLNFSPAFLGDAGEAACVNPAGLPTRPVAPGMPMPVAATYCVFNEAMTSVRGVAPPAAGPDDRRFQQFMYVMLTQLLPLKDPNAGGLCNEPEC